MTKSAKKVSLMLTVVLLGGWPVQGEEPEIHIEELFGDNPNIGGFLFPHLHTYAVFGDSTADPADLAVNGHDPNSQATLQSFEPGLSLMADSLQGFVNGSGTTNSAGIFDFRLEESYLKLVELSFGLEIRGGQYFNRFGMQNSLHNHFWMFVDQNLVNGRFLNEGELITQGGEISWNVPLEMLQASIISVSVGGAPAHGHGKEEHGGEAEFEADGASFSGTLVTANWTSEYELNSTSHLAGMVSGAWGDNGFGRETRIFGLGLEYFSHPEDHGHYSLLWRTEVMVRNIGAVSGHLHEEEIHEEEEEHRSSFDEFGIYSMLVYGIDDHWETGLRGDWVSGISQMGLDDRSRISPVITWFANEKRTLQARLQYNWDYSNRFGSEHSIWFQIGFNWESEIVHAEHDH